VSFRENRRRSVVREGCLVEEVEVGLATDGFAEIVRGHVLNLGSEGDGSFWFDGSEVANGSHPDFPMRVIKVLWHDRLEIVSTPHEITESGQPVIDVGALNVFLGSAVVSPELEGEAAQSNHAQEGCHAAKASKVSPGFREVPQIE
jgi:hypothetical protein